MSVFTLETSMPPSTNNAYKNVSARFGRSRVLTDDALLFKNETKWLIRQALKKQGWSYQAGQRLALSLELRFSDNRRCDLSNRIKLVEDCLAEMLGFDDSVIDRLEVARGPKSPREFCTVRLEPWGVSAPGLFNESEE